MAISASDYRNELEEAIQQQQVIGWGDFMFGRVSTKWSTALSLSYTGKRCKQMTTATMIHHIYNISYSMWEGRNKVLHAKEKQHKLLGAEEIDKEVKEQLALCEHNLKKADHHLVQIHLDELLEKDITYKEQWL